LSYDAALTWYLSKAEKCALFRTEVKKKLNLEGHFRLKHDIVVAHVTTGQGNVSVKLQAFIPEIYGSNSMVVAGYPE
jgi:hypothetical protein